MKRQRSPGLAIFFDFFLNKKNLIYLIEIKFLYNRFKKKNFRGTLRNVLHVHKNRLKCSLMLFNTIMVQNINLTLV